MKFFHFGKPQPPPGKMIATITVDCLNEESFNVRILAQEEEKNQAGAGEGADAQNNVEIEEDVLQTVGELREYIGIKLQVEPSTMKIIHRGTLIGTDPNQRLSTLKFRNNDKVKIMGKPIKQDPGFVALLAYERSNLIKLNKLFEQNGKDLDSLEKNFLEGKQRDELIHKTEKILRSFNETAERHLVAIDALNIVRDDTPEPQRVRNREKRKQIIDGVLQLLNLNDKYLHRLDDYKFRCEHPDEGR